MNFEKERQRHYKIYLLEIESDLKNGIIKKDEYGMIRKSKIFGLDANGKKIRGQVRKPTPEQCADALSYEYIKYLKGENDSIAEKTFTEVATEFIECDLEHRRILEKTKNNYVSIIKKHCVPYFKNQMIRNLKFGDYQKFLNYYDGYGEKLIKDIRMNLISILKFAMNYEYISYIACEKLKVPNYEPMKERDCFTDDEFEKLTKTAMHHYFCSEFITMTMCGLRPKELMNLKWNNVNLQNKTIIIEKSKTKYSQRKIPMCDLVFELLKDKNKTKKSEYVFTQKSNNNPHTDTTIHTSFRNLIRECDIENGAVLYRNKIVISTFNRDLTPYYCRHTFCTNLSKTKISNMFIIARLMGHSTKEIVTLGYTHLTDDEVVTKSKPYLKYINKKLEKIKAVV